MTIPNLGVSAQFFTQPVAGVTEFQFASSEDVENHILMRETIPEAEFQGSSLLLSPIPENAVSVVEASVVLMESSLQPFTQPVFETQPPEPPPLESLNELQVLLVRNKCISALFCIVVFTTISQDPVRE